MPKKVAIDFHNLSNYDYHFIIKVLVEESEGQFPCLGENFEKYITSSVPIQKKLQQLMKRKRKIQKPYHTDNNFSMFIKFIKSC